MYIYKIKSLLQNRNQEYVKPIWPKTWEGDRENISNNLPSLPMYQIYKVIMKP